jgi:erythromycin esterase-like protein
MAQETHGVLAEAVRTSGRPWSGNADDLEAFLEHVGDARLVLLGEASHGTHEFYWTRALLTQRLIAEKGFQAVVIEGDWPDAARVNRLIRGLGDDRDANEALEGFKRFPQWMWRNDDVLAMVEWLHDHNMAVKDRTKRAGFYGMDLYSLHASMEAVIRFLEETDPPAARFAKERYACFERFPLDASEYGRAAAYHLDESCEKEVLSMLKALHARNAALAAQRANVDVDAQFEAELNARVVVDAEQYYRIMWKGDVESWNLRDSHMVDTLAALERHLGRYTHEQARLVVWAHNSHLGDARATEFAERGELNVGQLVRERWGRESLLVGFSTDHGTVTAADNWDAPAERKRVRPSLDGSYEELFHDAGLSSMMLDLRNLGEAAAGLREPRLERAIGVVYRPQTERASHYFRANLPSQFDLHFHLDETYAVSPLERTARWEAGEAAETFPFGF